MDNPHVVLMLPLLLLLFYSSSSSLLAPCEGKQEKDLEYTFIVQVSKDMKPPIFSTLEDWYSAVLASVKGLPRLTAFGLNRRADIGIRYTYRNVFEGFAVTMTADQALALTKIPGFLSAMKDVALRLQTTRTPEFLGLAADGGGAINKIAPTSASVNPSIWRRSNYGDDVIIGVIDSGIRPEHPSFDDTGMGPVPMRWKGICESGNDSFNPAMYCNRKIIGARVFYKGYESSQGPINEAYEAKSPRDGSGHGTHTASTAAGRFIQNASFHGYAYGVASGMAPNARLAVYKVCWDNGCFDSDILAAFDTAVGDGVDIISLSIGGVPTPHHLDSIAIGSFGAMEKGILTVAAAGNDGPAISSVENTAPWLFTVAASSIDRHFLSTITIGNGISFAGSSLLSSSDITLPGYELPLVYARDAGYPTGNKTNAAFCMMDSLDPTLVAGKIVVCDHEGVSSNPTIAEIVSMAGGVATIIANSIKDGETLPADVFTSPATVVGYKAGQAIKQYIVTTLNPTANITFQGTVVNVKPSPTMASFSSRGPNSIVLDILKPDITAPGVNILAAWIANLGIASLPGQNSIADFNIISGTSMACPHISGLAALLKVVHPLWSASAIKSALMTTSTTIDNTGGPILDDFGGFHNSNPFIHGSGHVVPMASINPGLVYDMDIQNYVDFVCSLSYSPSQLRLFTKGKYMCNSNYTLKPGDLNYPSFSVVYKQAKSPNFSATFSRVLTNVDAGNTTYTLDLIPPYGVIVTVEPSILYFSQPFEKLWYKVTFEASPINLTSHHIQASYGSLAWKDGVHVVKSPIAFLWVNSM